MIRLERLRVENLGPIAGGEVRLSNMTVLTGPQGSGKGVLSVLAYMLEREVPSVLLFRTASALARELAGSVPAGETPVKSSHIGDLAGLASEVGRRVKDELEYDMPDIMGHYFTVSPGQLVRGGAGRGLVRAWFSVGGSELAEVSLELSGGAVGASAKVDPSGLARLVDLMELTLLDDGTLRFSPSLEPKPLFVPAERAAYVRSLAQLMSVSLGPEAHEQLPAPLVSQKVERKLGVPRHVADYIAKVHIALSSEGEYELLGLGRIKAGRGGATFIGGGAEIPPQLASAGIAHLAGALIPIQHAVRAGEPLSLVVVEEPEAGLHPDVQLELVDALASAAGNFRLVLTTHSDFVLAEVSYLNMARRLKGLSAYYIDDDHVIKELSVSSAGEVELPKSIARTLDSLSRRALSALANEGRSEPEAPA